MPTIDAWHRFQNVGNTELKVSVPVDVGPGGLQRVGVQFLNADAAYTGDFYIDGVSW